MNGNGSNNLSAVDQKKYLITEKSDLEQFTESKISNDLDAIKKAEIRSKKQFDITMDKKGNEVSRAMAALSLINPFKGV